MYSCKSARVLIPPFILNQTLSSRSKETGDITPFRSLHVGGGERRLKLTDDRKVSTGRTLRRRGAEFI
jgi:hypothetical protein